MQYVRDNHQKSQALLNNQNFDLDQLRELPAYMAGIFENNQPKVFAKGEGAVLAIYEISSNNKTAFFAETVYIKTNLSKSEKLTSEITYESRQDRYDIITNDPNRKVVGFICC